jgi:hypothetical protein
MCRISTPHARFYPPVLWRDGFMSTPEALFYSRKAWAWGKTCQDCGVNIPCALERTRDGIILCRECRLKRQGHPTTEQHHLFGRGERFTLAVPANLHACITEIEAAYGPLPVLLAQAVENILSLFGHKTRSILGVAILLIALFLFNLSHKGRAQPYPLIRYSSADKETQP